MLVVLRCPNGRLLLLCKGADANIADALALQQKMVREMPFEVTATLGAVHTIRSRAS